METSLMIAQIMGPLFIISSIIGILKPDNMINFVKVYLSKDNAALRYIVGMIELTTALAIIRVHNVWEMDWTVIITLIGWGMAIEGTLYMFGVNCDKKKDCKIGKSVFVIAGMVGVLLGVYLTAMGYKLV